jgi:hypothetical protein
VIGVITVQANGTGQVNAFVDRTVGGSTSITLYETNATTGAVVRSTHNDCSSSGSQRCWAPILSDRNPDFYYQAAADLVWASHGSRSGRTTYI